MGNSGETGEKGEARGEARIIKKRLCFAGVGGRGPEGVVHERASYREIPGSP